MLRILFDTFAAILVLAVVAAVAIFIVQSGGEFLHEYFPWIP